MLQFAPEGKQEQGPEEWLQQPPAGLGPAEVHVEVLELVEVFAVVAVVAAVVAVAGILVAAKKQAAAAP